MKNFDCKGNLNLMLFAQLCAPLRKSYDRELQRQRSKKSTTPRVAKWVLRTKIFSTSLENTLAYYNAGAVHSCKFRSRRIGSWNS
jgi:hypothetical protein